MTNLKPLSLQYKTSQEWVNCVLNDFNAFLQDHADCERKASAMAMSFVAKCPDKTEIIPELIDTALEELVHFKSVYKEMEKRGIGLPKEMEKDLYIQQLIGLCRSGSDDRLMDRMIMASIVEMRGAERFKLIADNIEDDELKRFYHMLYQSESKHGDIFIEMALQYWTAQAVYERVEFWLLKEAEICKNLKIRPALH